MSVHETSTGPAGVVVQAPSANIGASQAPDAGMFNLARLQPIPAGWWWAIAPATVAWLGGVAILGQYRTNQIADALGSLAPLSTIFWSSSCLAIVAIAVTAASGRRQHAVLWAGVLGYLLGHALFAWLPVHHLIDFRIPSTSTTDAVAFAKHRLVYGACVAASTGTGLALAAWLSGSWPRFHLGVGSWSALGRDFTHRSKPETYRNAMLGFAVFAAVLWVVGQMGVELKPLRSGVLWALVPAILLAALTNALVEEVIYRGMMQPAFVHAAGIARGLWIQALMFGMLHWGMSVGVVAALPTSLMIGIGPVYWGKAVLETRGLSWVIVAHAMVDVAIMCAYFVPRGS
jgi:membrane protease YdiL (CAAX protease family)